MPETKLEDESPMPFGAHKGKRMQDVPAKYLLWLYDNGTYTPNVGEYIVENWNALKKECPDYISQHEPNRK